MADSADIANDLVEWRLAQTLKAHQPYPDFLSFERCADCDEPIPEARRVAARGCTRCADCQAVVEKYGVRHAG